MFLHICFQVHVSVYVLIHSKSCLVIKCSIILKTQQETSLSNRWQQSAWKSPWKSLTKMHTQFHNCWMCKQQIHPVNTCFPWFQDLFTRQLWIRCHCLTRFGCSFIVEVFSYNMCCHLSSGCELGEQENEQLLPGNNRQKRQSSPFHCFGQSWTILQSEGVWRGTFQDQPR